MNQCTVFGCSLGEKAPLVYLAQGETLQTQNGLLVVKVPGWYCPKCAGSYGNYNYNPKPRKISRPVRRVR